MSAGLAWTGSAVLVAGQLALAAQTELPKPKESDYYTVDYLKLPEGAILEVGGMDFLPDGRLVVSTRRGQVWIVDEPLAKDPAAVRFHLFAEGLQDCLGLNVVDGQIYVVQRSELSRLVDEDQDGACDRIDTLCNDWGLSGNYHEFAYGLPRDAQGNFLISLNVSFFDEAWWLGAATVPWRGWVMQITPQGALQPFATGFRSPNGIGLSPQGELFVTDNQGDWQPAGPLFHVKQGRFYGHPAGLRWTPDYQASETEPSQHEPPPVEREAPALWFPYKWSRSAGNMIWDTSGGKLGPFAGQMIVAELTNGLLLRAQLEKVRGEWQGACFLMRQRVGSVNRVLLADEGTLFTGFTNRGWGGFPPSHGIGRMRWTGKTPFEMHEVHLANDGFEISFTQPLASSWTAGPETSVVLQYHYDYWWQYGSPEREVNRVAVEGYEVGVDRKSLRLRIPKLEAGRCARVILQELVSESGEPLLHEEFDYTINQFPDGPLCTTPIARAVTPPAGRDVAEAGWLRLCYDDALGLWNSSGWKLVDADYDFTNPSRFLITEGVGALVNVGPEPISDYASKPLFGDVHVHCDFTLAEGAELHLYLMGRYGIQLADTNDGKLCGRVLGPSPAEDRAPALKIYKGAGQKHMIDAVFEAPRFEKGVKTKNARLVKLLIDENPIQEDLEFAGPSADASGVEAATGPIVFRVVKGQVALGGIRALPLNRTKDDEGFAPIFNGEDVDGWKISEGGSWTIEDGVLTSGGKRSHIFSPRGDYKNFELRARVKISEGGNSGLYFRAQPTEDWPKGYEAQINASFPDPQRTGSLYELAPIQVALLPSNSWFEYRVRCADEAGGTRVQIWVEGVCVNDYLDAERRWGPGHIALQQHHEGSVVEIASLEIRELP